MPETPSAKETTSPFERLLADLVRSGVDYAVVGGVAVSLNGFIRATDDLDILVHEALGNIGRLLDCLAGWGEDWARELTPGDFAPQEGFIRVIEDFALDIFVRMRGHSLDEFRPRLQHLETSGVRIPYLGAGDLILLKQDSWREKDKLDVSTPRRLLGR